MKPMKPNTKKMPEALAAAIQRAKTDSVRRVGEVVAWHSAAHFCWGPIDGDCGIAHDSVLAAVNCLQRFRINKGGGFSDRHIYSTRMTAKGRPVCVPYEMAGQYSSGGAGVSPLDAPRGGVREGV